MSDTTAEALRDAYVRWVEPTTSAFARAALARADLDTGRSVLDVATGTGVLASAAARAGHRVEGIDLSASMLELAAERLAPYAGCGVRIMDASNPVYPDDSFDVAFSIFGVTLDAAVLPGALEHMVRMVRPGGVVGIVHWARTFGAPAPGLLQRALVELLDDPAPARAMTGNTDTASLERALAAAGCVEVSSEALTAESLVPEPDTALDEMHPLFGNQPAYAALGPEQRVRLRPIYAGYLRSAQAQHDGLLAHANLALGRVPG